MDNNQQPNQAPLPPIPSSGSQSVEAIPYQAPPPPSQITSAPAAPTPYAPVTTSQPPIPGTPAPAAGLPPPKTNPNSTQNTLQIAEIRDGIVIMNDGSFRCVVLVKSINFDLMSPTEREAVEYSYQGFLNSLYFPIQIFIRSEKVDLRPYIEKLDRIRSEHDNMLLALLMEDYVAYIDGLSQQTNIMDKRFYVIIPFFPELDAQSAIKASKSFFSGFGGALKDKEKHVVINEPDLEKAKAELRNRVQAVLGGLQQCGVQGLPLDTQELIELYYNSYNPDTATRQHLRSFEDISAPIITKGAGEAPQPNLDRELH